MAERTKEKRMSKDPVKRIVVTGPESTGKTELSFNLAKRLNTIFIPEYAREYVENLNRPYTYSDVESIARFQIVQEEMFEERAQNLLIFDTWLIITKVWFDLVFGKCPEWVISHIKSSHIDLFLICKTDLPWIPDPVRENGGEKREELLQLYCDEIKSFGFPYELVEGIGPIRTENALKFLSLHKLI
jgi:NadR type nicotinamide-nucleotide adenylyltransferase